MTNWSHKNTFVCIYIKVVSWEHICMYLYKSGLMTTYLCVLQSGLMKTILCVSIPKWSHENIFVCIYTKVVSWQRICVYYKVVYWKQFCVYLYQSGLMTTYLFKSIQQWSHENIFVCFYTKVASGEHTKCISISK